MKETALKQSGIRTCIVYVIVLERNVSCFMLQVIFIIYHVAIICSAYSFNFVYLCTGHYCPEGSAIAVPCPSGSYQDLLGQITCKLCVAGYYCDSTSQPVVDYTNTPCPSGRKRKMLFLSHCNLPDLSFTKYSEFLSQ